MLEKLVFDLIMQVDAVKDAESYLKSFGTLQHRGTVKAALSTIYDGGLMMSFPWHE